jgi:hypothetical protein
VQTVLPFVIIATLVVQGLPLRACAIEKIVTGSNCHAGELNADGNGGQCHVPHAPSRACMCETPKDPTPRQSSSAERMLASAPQGEADALTPLQKFSADLRRQLDRPGPSVDVSPPSLESVPLRL